MKKIEKEKVSVETIEVIEKIKKLIGVKRECDSFYAVFDESGDIVINVNIGLSVRYLSLSSTWSVLAGWMIRWDESAKESLISFFENIVIPVSMTLYGADDEYFNDIASSCANLYRRTGGFESEQPDYLNGAVSRGVFQNLLSE